MQETQETQVRSLGEEDLLEKGMAYTLQYSFLENSMDGGDFWAAIQRVTKSQAQLMLSLKQLMLSLLCAMQ